MQLRRSNRIKAASASVSNSITHTQTPRNKRSKSAANIPPATPTKKRKTGLKTKIDPRALVFAGVVDPESNINGTIIDLDNEPCDVMLVLVDPAKNMDKFYILQLIECADGTFVVYTRWGRTGTSGQALEQRFRSEEKDGAVSCFEKKFEEKSGLYWGNRSDPFVGNKYRYIKQNFGAKQNGFNGIKWQYWVDDGVDGKSTGWYDYTMRGSAEVERLFQEHSLNAHLKNRLVESGAWTYDVNLVQMIQTNLRHPNRTSRRIRRCQEQVVNKESASRLTSKAPMVKPASSTVKTAAASTTKACSKINGVSQSPPVDMDIAMFHGNALMSSLSVVKDDDGEWTDAVLNQCNIMGGNNNNKYYRIQLLEKSVTGEFYVWMKWSRVGEAPKASTKSLKGPFSTKDAAFSVFKKKYNDKTGNKWGPLKDFVPKTRKYDRIQIDNNVVVKDEELVKSKDVEFQYLPCSLDSKTKKLIELLFSKDMRDDALTTFNLDLKRLPLGVPSQQQIQIGVSILDEIKEKLNGGGSVGESYDSLSSRFYTAIPHSFGRRKPPVINSEAVLQQRYDMTDILLDMFSTSKSMLKIEEEEKASKKKMIPSPIDSHYKTLCADLSLIDEKTDEYKKIQQYFEKTKYSGSNQKLIDIWQVNRHGENKRFQKFDYLQNRKLLWHGTNIAVVAPIITSGLRIMPHSGGRVGSGIYLASMQEKSASYTSGYGSTACMFLCESVLGTEFKVTSDGSHASGLRKAPTGSDSVHAVGTITPKSWTSLKIDGKDVKIPNSPAKESGVSSSFHHDEHLVYDAAQVRLRYVVTVKMD